MRATFAGCCANAGSGHSPPHRRAHPEIAPPPLIEVHLIPCQARAGLQDIEFARVSQEVTERFCNRLTASMSLPGRVVPVRLRSSKCRPVYPDRDRCAAIVDRQLGATSRFFIPQGRPKGRWKTYSMTSSARALTVGGNSKPSSFADFRFITNSNFVGTTTGRSAGLAPLRIRPA